MKTVAKALLALAAAFVATSSAAATCAERSHVVTALQDRFGERLISNAESRSGAVLEVYAAENAETWSIVIHLADRPIACLAATGKGREDLDQMMAAYH